MRAALIEQHGAPPVVGEHPEPSPSTGQALVAVRAAPITPLDVLCASGTSYFGAQPVPYVPGVQGVGVVEAGSSVAPGSSVWFPTTAGMRPGDGSMADLALASEEELVVLPEDVEPTVVAALGLSAVAAWMVLTWRARMQPGEQVLVLGAGGVVGQVAVQAAKRLGAGRVVAACRSTEAQQRASACGADAVVPLYDGEDAAALAARLAGACDGPLDVVVDPLFGAPASAAASLLGPRGRLVNLGSSAGETAVLRSDELRSRTASVLGYTNNDLTSAQRSVALLEVLRHARETGLSVAHDVVPLADVGTAWANQASGAARRRIVLQVG